MGRAPSISISDRSVIAQRIIAGRHAAGLRQRDLAHLADVDRTQVANWETDVNTPSVANLIAIADALEVSLDWLVGRTTTVGLAAPPGGDGSPRPSTEDASPDTLEQTESSSGLVETVHPGSHQLLPSSTTTGPTPPRAVLPGVAARGGLLDLAHV